MPDSARDWRTLSDRRAMLLLDGRRGLHRLAGSRARGAVGDELRSAGGRAPALHAGRALRDLPDRRRRGGPVRAPPRVVLADAGCHRRLPCRGGSRPAPGRPAREPRLPPGRLRPRGARPREADRREARQARRGAPHPPPPARGAPLRPGEAPRRGVGAGRRDRRRRGVLGRAGGSAHGARARRRGAPGRRSRGGRRALAPLPHADARGRPPAPRRRARARRRGAPRVEPAAKDGGDEPGVPLRVPRGGERRRASERRVPPRPPGRRLAQGDARGGDGSLVRAPGCRRRARSGRALRRDGHGGRGRCQASQARALPGGLGPGRRVVRAGREGERAAQALRVPGLPPLRGGAARARGAHGRAARQPREAALDVPGAPGGAPAEAVVREAAPARDAPREGHRVVDPARAHPHRRRPPARATGREGRADAGVEDPLAVAAPPYRDRPVRGDGDGPQARRRASDAREVPRHHRVPLHPDVRGRGEAQEPGPEGTRARRRPMPGAGLQPPGNPHAPRRVPVPRWQRRREEPRSPSARSTTSAASTAATCAWSARRPTTSAGPSAESRGTGRCRWRQDDGTVPRPRKVAGSGASGSVRARAASWARRGRWPSGSRTPECRRGCRR